MVWHSYRNGTVLILKLSQFVSTELAQPPPPPKFVYKNKKVLF